MQLASEEVPHRQAAVDRVDEPAVGQDLQAGQVGGDFETNTGRRGVGVRLDPVDAQHPAFGGLVAADGRLVGGVGATVQGVEVTDEVGEDAVARFVVVVAARAIVPASRAASVVAASAVAAAAPVLAPAPAAPPVFVLAHAPILTHRPFVSRDLETDMSSRD